MSPIREEKMCRRLPSKLAGQVLWLISSMVLAACWLSAQQASQPTLILHNAKVLTVDKSFSVAQAVAVTGNRITAVGSDADVMKMAGPNTQVLDLKGRTVIPGLMDTHLHYTGLDYGGDLSEPERTEFRVDWRGVRTKEDVLVQIKGIIEKYKIPKGQWMHFQNELQFQGEGNETTQIQGRILFNELNRWELDKAAPDK